MSGDLDQTAVGFGLDPVDELPDTAGSDSAPAPAPHVVVIGAGIGGLASAALLARDGYRVTLLEKQLTVGGRVGSWEQDGFRFDTGPSWYLMPEVFDHFYKLLGTSAAEQLDLVRLDPGYRVYFEDQPDPVDIQSSREANVALFESLEPGAGRRLEKYLDSAKGTYDIALKRFLYTSFESVTPLFVREVVSRLGKLSSLLLRPIHGYTARVGRDLRIRQILGYPAVFLGSSPFTTPAMYHLMSHLDLEDGVLYPMGGFVGIIRSIERLALAEGVTIETNAPVTRILTDGARATGVEYRRDGATRTLDADVVVSAADLHHTETALLPEDRQTYGEAYWRKRTAGPGALLLLLGVEGEVPELEHHTLLFAKDWTENFDAIFGRNPSVPDAPSLYVCKPSGIDASVAPDGMTNLFVLVPVPADPALGTDDAERERLADRVIEQIAAWTGVHGLSARVRVRRVIAPSDFASDINAWQGSALGPAHTLAQSAMFRAGNRSRTLENLFYAGSSTIPGIGLPMCLISAEVLVKRMRRDISTTPLAEPLSPTVRPRRAAQPAPAAE
ncbi:phytoene desaturase family protein [Desertivibrio insolitus]|uniref:phytoene desaturase family protein n=1 Tax=Herbiconiux sp. SYSU D00978 TaxID=2812562 RepID=UPI001A979F4F|nr:phytoene desaturase family protein [Herbiconiux sp. SYSU D00978]